MKIPKVIKQEFGDIGQCCSSPDFWLATPESATSFIESLKNVTIRNIGSSAGGREIIALEYGEKEALKVTTDNLQASLTSTGRDPVNIFPKVFYGEKRRSKPVLVLQGAIHGGELTGTVAALNLCNIIEKGVDLRGKAWPELRELALKTRILIIPWLNPDGTARWPLSAGPEISLELYQRFTFGVSVTGEKLTHGGSKQILPIQPDKMELLGSYFNDNGQNLQYDFCLPERQPETEAWMKYYLAERPDGVMAMHCDNGSLLSVVSHILPTGFKFALARLGGTIYRRLRKEGLNIRRATYGNLPDFGQGVLDQVGAIYLTCGGMPFLAEFPAGTGIRPFTFDQLLDIGLLTFEEVLYFAHHEGFRPYESWDEDVLGGNIKKTMETT